MRIGVLSPVSHGTGASCISLLLALKLGQGTERVCLTHTHPTDTSLRDASGVVGTVDRTMTPSMIKSTFQNMTSMTESECAQYCASVTRDVDLFTCTRAGDAVCSCEDSRFLARYVAEKFPHKHVVVDADDHNDTAMEEVIKYCDVIVFAIRVSKLEIRMLKQKLEQYKKDGLLTGKRIALVFNRYHNAVVKQKELSAMMGVKPAYIYCLDFNEYIAWAHFNCKFPQFWQFVIKGDSRVTKIRSELDRLVQNVRQQKVTTSSAADEIKLLGVARSALTPRDGIKYRNNAHAAETSNSSQEYAYAAQMHAANAVQTGVVIETQPDVKPTVQQNVQIPPQIQTQKQPEPTLSQQQEVQYQKQQQPVGENLNKQSNTLVSPPLEQRVLLGKQSPAEKIANKDTTSQTLQNKKEEPIAINTVPTVSPIQLELTLNTKPDLTSKPLNPSPSSLLKQKVNTMSQQAAHYANVVEREHNLPNNKIPKKITSGGIMPANLNKSTSPYIKCTVPQAPIPLSELSKPETKVKQLKGGLKNA